MSLEEYLYVDDRRLDTYVEQLGAPIAYDKVPTWTAKLSLLGPARAEVNVGGNYETLRT